MSEQTFVRIGIFPGKGSGMVMPHHLCEYRVAARQSMYQPEMERVSDVVPSLCGDEECSSDRVYSMRELEAATVENVCQRCLLALVARSDEEVRHLYLLFTGKEPR